MEEAQWRFLFLFTDLIAPLIAGYVFKQRRFISQQVCDKLVKFNIRIIVSILSLLSFWTLHITTDLLLLPLLGILVCVVPGVVAQFTFAKRYNNLDDRGAYMMAAMLSNIGTLAGLGAFIVYGIRGFAYMQIVAMFQTLFTLLYCFPLANYYHAKQHGLVESNGRINFLRLLFNVNQLPVLTMLVGLYLAITGIPQPHSAIVTFNALVHVGAWAGLFPVGYMIEFSSARPYLLKTLDLALVKFIILPVIAYLIFTPLFSNRVLLGTLLLGYAAPTAINAVLAANLYKLNVNITVASFIVTTIIFLVVVFPLFFFVGQYYI